MARHLPPIEETLAAELYNYLIDFIEANGTIPIERAFWGWLIRTNRYTSEQLPVTTFHYYFERLRNEDYIAIEPITRSLRPLRQVKIVINR